MAINFLNNGNFPDGAKLTFGDSDDGYIYHSGANTYVGENGSGALYLQGQYMYLEAEGGDMYIDMNDAATGRVRLYYDNSVVLATNSSGIEVTSKVGIGMAPTEVLDIKTASGDCRMRLDAPAASDTEIKFFNAGVAQYTIGHDDATDNFVIGGANVDAPLVSVDKSGNVYLLPTKKLYLDSGSSTYIYESSDGVIDFIGDGVDLVSMKQNGTQSEVVVNESSGDVDFRVESNSDTHAFFVEAAGAGKVGFRTSTPESAMDVNGTLRARNELNVGPTTEQNFFAAGGSLSSGERYIKAGYYGKGFTTPPPNPSFPGAEDANSIRTSAAFGPNGKFIEDLIYTVVKIEPAGFQQRQGLGSGNPALIINPYGANTFIVLDHVTVFKTSGSGTFCNSGGTSGEGGFSFCQFENVGFSGSTVANLWNMPAAVANREAAFIYSRPAWVAQGTTQVNSQPNAILNNQGGTSTVANRGVYMRTACDNYSSNPTSATFYCRIAYRVFRRGVDFVSATALTISGSGSGGNGPGGTLTSFTRTTSAAVFNDVCSATGTATAYHDGSGTYPTTGDNVYTGSDGGAFVSGGYYKMPAANSWIRITGSSGEVTAEGSC